MKRITVRMQPELFKRLKAEVEQWQIARGPKFSLNDLCLEKLGAFVAITEWPREIRATRIPRSRKNAQ